MTEMQSLAKSGKVWQSLDFAFQLVTEKQSLTKFLTKCRPSILAMTKMQSLAKSGKV